MSLNTEIAGNHRLRFQDEINRIVESYEIYWTSSFIFQNFAEIFEKLSALLRFSRV